MALTTLIDATTEYEKAYKAGKREGEPVASLDDLLKEKNEQIIGELPLGLIQIPSELVVGTKTSGRSSALSKSFYPLLADGSEFASKWQALYKAHLEEGIREPIKAYEYMNRYYVQEGNKRVSVLKYCDAVSIMGNVIRLVPRRSKEKDNILYYEYMDFYALSGINYISFSKFGSFARLQSLLGKQPDEVWTDDDKLNFASVYNRFSLEFEARKKKNMTMTCGDAFLYLLGLYSLQELLPLSNAEFKAVITKIWPEFQVLIPEQSLELQMDPQEKSAEPVKTILNIILPTAATRQKVGFIHEKNLETSGWTYSHDLGRSHIENVFKDEISVKSYFDATAENADEMLEKAIKDGCKIIFTTSPPLLKASLKAAIEHPEVKILNCSLNASHRSIRTYYARMYEAKFLMGAIAGAMTTNDKVGYVADYPIYGMTANINAFALGAKMVNPRAKVYLEWSTVKDQNIYEKFAQNEVEYISGLDVLPSKELGRHFGLYSTQGNEFLNLAMPVWNWGKFYEKMIHNILNGTWKYDSASDSTKGLNYWWGMSSGMIDVICSHHLPIGTARLVYLLKETIMNGHFNPFTGELFSQAGVVQRDRDRVMTPEEIITMDWLAENVIGYIPKMEDLIEKAKPVVSKSGIDKPSDDATLI